MKKFLMSFRGIFSQDSFLLSFAISFVVGAFFGIVYALVSYLGIYYLGNPYAYFFIGVAPVVVFAIYREGKLVENMGGDYNILNILTMSVMPLAVLTILILTY